MTLADTNVLIDLFLGGSAWEDWSAEALSWAASRGPVLINDVVFAGLSIGFDRQEECEAFLSDLQVAAASTP